MSKALLALLLFVAFLPNAALAQTSIGSGLIVVDGVNLAPKVPRGHESMRASLEKALGRDWMVVQFAAGADCARPAECMSKLAKDTGVNYVLRLTGDRNQDDGYNVMVELFRASTAGIDKTMAYCDYCTVERMADVVGRTALGMLATAAKDDEALKRKSREQPSAVPVAAIPPAAAPPLLADTPQPTPVAESTSSKSWIPLTMFGVGALAGGYGLWALRKDGDSTGSSCLSVSAPTKCEHYSSKTTGTLALVGGGLLAAAGVAWEIVILVKGTSTSVAIAPDSVALTTRF